MKREWVGHVSDRAAAWRRLGDTDFLNQAAGLGPVSYEMVGGPDEAPVVRGSMEGPGGLTLPFEETYNGWVRERWFRQERTFDAGPVLRSRFHLRLDAEDDGVRPYIELELEPRLLIYSPALVVRLRAIGSAWREVLDSLPGPGEVSAAVDRALEPALTVALERWAPRAPASLARLLEDLIRGARPMEVRQLRAYELADRCGVERQTALRAMLHGVFDGLLELYWSARCPRCHGEVGARTSLSDLADHAQCTSCGIAFEADLSENVEVLFAPHPSVFRRSEERFCTLFPSGAPTLLAALPLGAGGEATERLDVSADEHLAFGIGRGMEDLLLSVEASGAQQVHYEGDGGRSTVAQGEVTLSFANPTAKRQRLLLRSLDDRGVVPAIDVATMPEARRQLGTELLATSIRVGSRRVALLFTDLSGSTALYASVGDAAAYALVRDHFDLLRQQVEAHDGVVVKTIGDAVMACFDRVDHALRAGVEMRKAFDGWMARNHPSHDVVLNVGINVGVALGVHTDALGLDWFGQQVNLAARAQGAATDGALVVTQAVLDDGLVQPILDELGPPEPFEVSLKGLGTTTLQRWRRTP